LNIFNMSLAATFIILAVIVVRLLFIHKLPKKPFCPKNLDTAVKITVRTNDNTNAVTTYS
jgi:hypothetical protein